MHRARLVAAAFVAAFAVALPLGVFAAHQFSDVPDSNPFHADIDALADSGVTTGCGTGIYCPKDYVTREQMAAFMNRLGALAPSKTPVVNADRLDGLDSTAFLPLDGVTLVSGGLQDWSFTNAAAPITTDRSDLQRVRFTRSAAGYNYLRYQPDVPVVLAGQPMALTGVEVCYGASATAVLTDVWVYVPTPVSGVSGTVTTAFNTMTDFTDNTCRTFALPAPVPFSEDTLGPILRLGVQWEAGAFIDVGRVTFALAPAATAVAVDAAGATVLAPTAPESATPED